MSSDELCMKWFVHLYLYSLSIFLEPLISPHPFVCFPFMLYTCCPIIAMFLAVFCNYLKKHYFRLLMQPTDWQINNFILASESHAANHFYLKVWAFWSWLKSCNPNKIKELVFFHSFRHIHPFFFTNLFCWISFIHVVFIYIKSREQYQDWLCQNWFKTEMKQIEWVIHCWTCRWLCFVGIGLVCVHEFMCFYKVFCQGTRTSCSPENVWKTNTLCNMKHVFF